ncbi:hypothetical protein SH661x_002890 [Planctomicrobium sp. SH661]|uniref:hypothetical protein n=1 Tax=Planctomicrobium sp. SH661 TaxID=3448124 RepID=UPI003F5AEA1E
MARSTPTPRNGSRLSMTEIELGVISHQCLNCRIPTVTELQSEMTAWQAEQNVTASNVRWQFTTSRRKLHRLYPQL